MVRILASGEVVADNDPRANQANTRRNAENRQPATGNVNNPQQGPPAPGQQITNMIGSANQRLIDLGIPRFSIGQTSIEPIASIGFLSAYMFFGLSGVLIGAVIFAASTWSKDGPPEFVSRLLGNDPSSGRRNDGSNAPGGGGGSGSRGGRGFRLGRS